MLKHLAPKIKVKSHYMRHIDSLGDRSKITRIYKNMLKEKNLTTGFMNNTRREILSEAIFQHENDTEHRSDGIHTDKVNHRLHQMNEVRNRIYDDLRWNEYAHIPASEYETEPEETFDDVTEEVEEEELQIA